MAIVSLKCCQNVRPANELSSVVPVEYLHGTVLQPSLTHPSDDYSPAPVYCGLRDGVLRLPTERAASGFEGNIGALMESGYKGAVATLVALLDGTTSLYLSTGGGVIGAGDHKSVTAVTTEFVNSAIASLSLMQFTESYPLPHPQHSRFYLLTTMGVWTAEGPDQDLGHNRHALSRLFHRAHAVITAIRQLPTVGLPETPS